MEFYLAWRCYPG